MADEDEDAPKLRNQEDDEIDASEETQDFRFLNNLHAFDPGNLSLPKRGEKDFETDATNLQLDTLEASRQAMHSVLSWTRVHKDKNRILGMYHAESNMAYVEKAKTQMFQTIGRAKGGKEWLLPEEALFLIERGSMDCRWPVKEEEGETANIEDGAPMSLQGAYSAFIGFEEGVGGKLTLEMYNVYAGLRRSGYIVFRTGSWDDDFGVLRTDMTEPKGSELQSQGSIFYRFFAEIWRRISTPNRNVTADGLRFGPLVKPGLYRNYADIYRLLKIVPTHDRKAPPSFVLPADRTNPYRLHFDVYKTGTGKFSKARRGDPDFRVAVISARDTPLPTSSQLNDLLATAPYSPPDPANKNMYARLKHGTRNVILAVVDNGLPSYINVADTPFDGERLFENSLKPFRGKGGGRGRGGRGRGRGGRGRGR
ncbi:tRNA splicing endonuclease-like protein subunit [Aaosphaeria arxii CBS 175.79]|uniref:tRNA splicing endonuclease-like protein subunit n=1 Tax=Aaosphaeria arxii CBS 175.79 TaxID=1450172 RepID=A0A6A5Y0Y0_9PLEO|nr:tRNA splicing endonuclease-like protein subunit [Aaosphaeria arxii CBS 175.79]KAF2018853.1 tRNA splicing endonuclease-like protein subunit [Aaosphaeria arxii CBS 175.79]